MDDGNSMFPKGVMQGVDKLIFFLHPIHTIKTCLIRTCRFNWMKIRKFEMETKFSIRCKWSLTFIFIAPNLKSKNTDQSSF